MVDLSSMALLFIIVRSIVGEQGGAGGVDPICVDFS